MIHSAKEAKEIVDIHRHQKLAIQNALKFNPTHEARYLFIEANAYLTALKGPEVKALVEALERISRITQFDHPKNKIIGSEEYEGAWLDCLGLADEALIQYSKVIKP